jgi:hypothetical protein
MARILTYDAFRRGVGVIAIIAFSFFSFVLVPRVAAFNRGDRGSIWADGTEVIHQAPGDNDNIGGARYHLLSTPGEDVGSANSLSSGLSGGGAVKTSIVKHINWRDFLRYIIGPLAKK